MIARVFPSKTKFTPIDRLAFIGYPPLKVFRPEVDEVHISCTFTWDIEKCLELQAAWAMYYPVVKIGGPAFNSPCPSFEAGLYVKRGVTFTTRGCNNNCPWCFVPKREGKLQEIRDFEAGYQVQDNNILQASRQHQRRVFEMLRSQKNRVEFSGGLQASLIDDWFANEVQSLRVYQVFLAADTKAALKPLEQALKKLAFLGRDRLRVFTLLAYNGETISDALGRLEMVWELGGMPFAQLYQPDEGFINYSKEWRDLARKWSRPAIMKSMHSKKHKQIRLCDYTQQLRLFQGDDTTLSAKADNTQ